MNLEEAKARLWERTIMTPDRFDMVIRDAFYKLSGESFKEDINIMFLPQGYRYYRSHFSDDDLDSEVITLETVDIKLSKQVGNLFGYRYCIWLAYEPRANILFISDIVGQGQWIAEYRRNT